VWVQRKWKKGCMKKKDYVKVELLQIDSTVTKLMMRRAEPDTTSGRGQDCSKARWDDEPESLPPLGEKTRCHESAIRTLLLSFSLGVSHHST
jgi:hypothetical protein